MNSSTNPARLRVRKSSQFDSSRSRTPPSMHWLFRTNIPRHRNSYYLPPDTNKRNFFGMSDIVGVLTNPAETVRSLTESKRLLDEARREISENRERSQLRPKHTFSRLPGFFPRKAEILAIERTLEGEPSFTVLFGASSTGKTALLREVLSREQYHVLHFDLRIAGFADLASLYLSLSQQMELYFEEISSTMQGYEEFKKEAWSFKHDRLNVQRRVEEAPSDSKAGNVRTSDIARLMELFQSSLLRYWEFQPLNDRAHQPNSKSRRSQEPPASDSNDRSHVGRSTVDSWRVKLRSFQKASKGKERQRNLPQSSARNSQAQAQGEDARTEKEKEKPLKKMPVIFFDEAHKLPALIQSSSTMKCLLDSMLVLTKQDRLCHVIHATSDPFYQTWLRQFNVMQHCKIITIGDCSKSETKAFFRESVLPRVPERLRVGLHFENLYEAFGGKLAHWQDYITDYVNSNGKIDVKQCSHFLQAHALLNLHIIHSSQSASAQETADTSHAANTSNPETLHPGLGPAGFKIYSPIANSTSPVSGNGMGMGMGTDDRSTTMVAGYYSADFSAMQLLKVMSRLTQPDAQYLPYFLLCRELGVRAVDGMVKGRVLDLRWTETVSRENVDAPPTPRVRSGVTFTGASFVGQQVTVPPLPESVTGSTTRVGSSPLAAHAQGSSGTMVDLVPQPSSDEGMVPVSEHEFGQRDVVPVYASASINIVSGGGGQRDVYEEAMEVVGPKLVPTTPIMRFAMRDVVQEYEDDQSMSEYASLSDVDEY